MKAPMLVTAAVIMRDGKLLIAQRLPDSRFEPDKWEFPGGKVDFGEHPEESLRRELREELGIEVKVGPHYSTASHVYDQRGEVRHVVILFYICKIEGGEPEPLDCQDLRFVTRDELGDYVFVEGDGPIITKVLDDDDLWIMT